MKVKHQVIERAAFAAGLQCNYLSAAVAQVVEGYPLMTEVSEILMPSNQPFRKTCCWKTKLRTKTLFSFRI